MLRNRGREYAAEEMQAQRALPEKASKATGQGRGQRRVWKATDRGEGHGARGREASGKASGQEGNQEEAQQRARECEHEVVWVCLCL